jgi:phosphatidylglycerol:prolipoprotein diacylglycerol transferase
MMLFIQYPTWLKPEIFPMWIHLPLLGQLRWYSLGYIVAFLFSYSLLKWQINRQKNPLITVTQLSDLAFWLMLFMVLGGRLLYVLVYAPQQYLTSLSGFISILWPFEGKQFVGIQGLSYHGGVLGFVLAIAFMSRRYKVSFWALTDFIIPALALSYTFGRLGNFANAELYGKVTAWPLGMIFPQADPVLLIEPWAKEIAIKTGMIQAGEPILYPIINLPRHASQLYEALSEGLLLGLILMSVSFFYAKKFDGLLSSIYLFGYGLFRFIIEYVREPDSQLGFVIKGGPGADTPQVFTSFANISMGQILCLAMIIAGIVLWLWSYARHKKAI